MRKIPYTDIEIYQDPRMAVVRKILSELTSKTYMTDCITVVMPDNTMIAVCQLTVIYSCILKECINGYTMYIDPRSFDPQYIEEYKLQEDEYVYFNQASSSIYLNINNAIQSYYYNLDKYILIDKIEDITDYEDFKNEYLTLKSDQGRKFFKGYNENFIIPIFTRFPTISKSDKASLYIYNYTPDSDLIVWKIYKKKLNRDVYVIFRVLKLF